MNYIIYFSLNTYSDVTGISWSDDLSCLDLMLQWIVFMLSLMYLNKPRKFNLYHNRFQILFLQLLKTHTEKMNKVFINKLQ